MISRRSKLIHLWIVALAGEVDLEGSRLELRLRVILRDYGDLAGSRL